MNVSKESREFLDNLRIYLLSSGKNEKEMEEIIEELEDHLVEAEKNGKNVADIIGQTPKEYMSQLANEIPFDFIGLLKWLPVIFLGAFSYIIMGDAIRGVIEYSLLELAGYPIIFLLFLFLTSISFKYIASSKKSKTKEWFIFGFLGFVPIALFTALLFLNKTYHTYTIQFGTVGNMTALVVSILVMIGIAAWGKTWIPIIIPILQFLPEILINMTAFHENTKLLLTGIVPPLCIGIYLFTIIKMEKKKAKIIR